MGSSGINSFVLKNTSNECSEFLYRKIWITLGFTWTPWWKCEINFVLNKAWKWFQLQGGKRWNEDSNSTVSYSPFIILIFFFLKKPSFLDMFHFIKTLRLWTWEVMGDLTRTCHFLYQESLWMFWSRGKGRNNIYGAPRGCQDQG